MKTKNDDNRQQPLHEGYSYERGSQTGIKPVVIRQPRRPVPKPIKPRTDKQ